MRLPITVVAITLPVLLSGVARAGAAVSVDSSPRSKTTIYVNFDGAQLDCTGNYHDDSRTNSSWVCGMFVGVGPYAYAAYDGNETQRAAILQATRDDWAPFQVDVVNARPDQGDYTMAMVGPSNFVGGGALGIAPVDCEDSVKNNIVFAFNDSQQFVDIAATAISQEVAHAYGLEHVNDVLDVMHPQSGGGAQAFRDLCSPLVNTPQCNPQHSQHCAGGQQNSFQELMSLFGPAAPDLLPPTVQITAPPDGTQVPTGSDFTVKVTANDDEGVEVVDLYVDGGFENSISSPPYDWPVVGIPEGEHEFYAIARDAAGNETISAVVTVYAGGAGDGDGDGDGDGGGDGWGTDGGDGGADDGDPAPSGVDTGEDSETGCGCVAGPRGGGNGWPVALSLLGLLGISRRSRSA